MTSPIDRDILIAVDPGVTGAIAVFDSDRRDIQLFDMPSAAAGIAAVLSEYRDVARDIGLRAVAILERQQAHEKTGRASAVKIGIGQGRLEGVLAAFGFRVELVTPAKWKRAMGLDADKEKSRALAQQLFPLNAGDLLRKKDHNRAEALLIGEWWRRQGEPAEPEFE